jgi:hypothetical protein
LAECTNTVAPRGSAEAVPGARAKMLATAAASGKRCNKNRRRETDVARPRAYQRRPSQLTRGGPVESLQPGPLDRLGGPSLQLQCRCEAVRPHRRRERPGAPSRPYPATASARPGGLCRTSGHPARRPPHEEDGEPTRRSRVLLLDEGSFLSHVDATDAMDEAREREPSMRRRLLRHGKAAVREGRTRALVSSDAGTSPVSAKATAFSAKQHGGGTWRAWRPLQRQAGARRSEPSRTGAYTGVCRLHAVASGFGAQPSDERAERGVEAAVEVKRPGRDCCRYRGNWSASSVRKGSSATARWRLSW